jgi:hypothetical protein
MAGRPTTTARKRKAESPGAAASEAALLQSDTSTTQTQAFLSHFVPPDDHGWQAAASVPANKRTAALALAPRALHTLPPPLPASSVAPAALFGIAPGAVDAGAAAAAANHHADGGGAWDAYYGAGLGSGSAVGMYTAAGYAHPAEPRWRTDAASQPSHGVGGGASAGAHDSGDATATTAADGGGGDDDDDGDDGEEHDPTGDDDAYGVAAAAASAAAAAAVAATAEGGAGGAADLGPYAAAAGRPLVYAGSFNPADLNVPDLARPLARCVPRVRSADAPAPC